MSGGTRAWTQAGLSQSLGSWLDTTLLCPAPPPHSPHGICALQAAGMGSPGPCGPQKAVGSKALAAAGTSGGLARVLQWPQLTPKPRLSTGPSPPPGTSPSSTGQETS